MSVDDTGVFTAAVARGNSLVAYRSSGESWGAGATLEAASVTTSDVSGAVVAWRVTEIKVSTWNGTAWPTPVDVSDAGETVGAALAIVSPVRGKAIVTWSSNNGADSVIRAAVLEAGQWGSAATISPTFRASLGLATTMDRAGGAAVGWIHSAVSWAADPLVQAVTWEVRPNRPAGVTVRRGNGTIAVSWRAPDGAGATPVTGYTVTAQPGGRSCTWTSGPLTCRVDGLTNGQPYVFRVTATNDASTSAAARSASIVPAAKPSVPREVRARAATNSANVTWRAPANTGGMPIRR